MDSAGRNRRACADRRRGTADGRDQVALTAACDRHAPWRHPLTRPAPQALRGAGAWRTREALHVVSEERQRRNRAWLANHPVLLATIFGTLYGLLAFGFGQLKWDDRAAFALGALGL